MTKILGKSQATAEQMAAYLLKNNSNPNINMDVLSFCRLFLYIAAVEGVRGDCLFAQSCHETGFFKFTGTVKPEQNNYAGIGTTDASTPGAYFPEEATGILAQAQHAKCYATSESLNFNCVDPRYDLLVSLKKAGTAENWEDLGGTWAVPGYDTKKYSSLKEANAAGESYGYKIIKHLNGILSFNADGTVKEEPKVETVGTPTKVVCLDAGHYGKYNVCPGNPAYYESEVMWKLHLRQKKYLEKLGIKVVTTRSNLEDNTPLISRGHTAAGCDLFISNHSNAVGSYTMNETVDYVMAYHMVDDNMALCDDVSKDFANKIVAVVSKVMGTKQNYELRSKKIDSDRNGDGQLNDNYYGVLHGAREVNVPGLILEHSFHTNTTIVNWLLNDSNLDKLARAEAECIASYLLGKTVTIPADTTSTGSMSPNSTSATNGIKYKVQIGAYSIKANAENRLKTLIKAGFDAFVVEAIVDGGTIYRVQLGAFKEKSNAIALRDKVIAAGFKAIVVEV